MPSEVKLGHHRGRMPAEFRRLFGTHVAFSSAVDEIKYPGFIARTPITSADPYLNALLVQYCEDALAGRRSKSSAWRVKVENAIVPLLPHGQARIGEISKQLGVSSRTLARRLASEGITFVKVLDDLRFDLAKRYLQERELPLSEIAWLLGYRESSALSHAFKRWTGTAPRDARPRNASQRFSARPIDNQ
jgi:AraC-like DNA-binding protein